MSVVHCDADATAMKQQWRSSDGLVHIMKMKAFGPRPVCYGPYAPDRDTQLIRDAPTCLARIYYDTFFKVPLS